MEPIEVIEKGNMRGEIYYDEDCESPRESCDNFGTMICSHKRYNLGDVEASKDVDFYEFGSWDDIEEYLIKKKHAEVILPLSLYDHSGISMHIGRCSGWDSGQVGFIYASKEDCIKEFGKKFSTDHVEKLLRSEVEEYDMFIRGECYWYKVTERKKREILCPHCNKVIGDEEYDDDIDSCGGFIGQKYVLEEVKAIMGIKE